jgi:antitoxin component of MazEF toxin-antitoxin module
MGEVFKTKVRSVGTSLGILIPKSIAMKDHIRIGEEIEVALLKRRRLELIEKAFGLAKGSESFKREHRDRF